MTILLEEREVKRMMKEGDDSFLSLILGFGYDLFYRILEIANQEYPAAGVMIPYDCVIEKQLNGGIMIRPYRKDLDYYLPTLKP